MRILVVSEVFYPEPGLVNDFVREMVARGHRVEVLTQHPSYPEGRVHPPYRNVDYATEEWEGVLIHRFRMVEGYRESLLCKLRNYCMFARRGARIARRIGPGFDRVLVYQTGPLTVAWPGVALRRHAGVPLTVWTFDIWPDAVYSYGFPRIPPLTTLLGGIIRRVYGTADRILSSSEDFAPIITRYAPGRRVVYAPGWLVEPAAQRSVLRLEPGCFHVLFTGNVSRAQNLERVLRAWKRAAIEGALLDIVGDGSRLDALRTLVRQERIEGVRFHGRYPVEQMADLQAQADALLLPLVPDPGVESTEPYKLHAYLRAGRPILCLARGTVARLIAEYGLGVVADPSDEERMADAMRRMPAFVREHGVSVKEAAERLRSGRYDRGQIIDRVEAVLKASDQRV